ncbi:hypothetical protein QOZ80_8BG0650660 [Eleusine coracana subsp. coracana]|nr:hypothetical protein QOZ80_8BG0650660 [Eleusine coracana subsp. coracana]
MSANNSPPMPKTGKHVFEVTSYSYYRCLDAGHFVRSDAFNVAGYAWSICFYPGGDGELEDSSDYAAISLELVTKDALVEVSYNMAVIDITTGKRWLGAESEKAELDTGTTASFWCLSRFKRRTELEASPYLCDDRIVIECALTVIKGSHVVPTVPETVAPSPLYGAQEDDKEKDVILDVPRGSFVAEYGIRYAVNGLQGAAGKPGEQAMKEGTAALITVRDVQAAAILALLGGVNNTVLSVIFGP